MEFLQSYGEDEPLVESERPKILTMQINSAPTVESTNVERVVDFTKRQITTNPTYDVMWNNPLQTVQTPWGTGNLVPGERNTLTGFVEDAYLNDYAFDSQHHAFQSTGKGLDPNSNAVQITSFENKKKRKKENKVEPKTEVNPNPSTENEEEKANEVKDNIVVEEEEESTPKSKKVKVEYEPTFTQHIHVERDYQGRTWIDPASGIKPGKDHDCFIPKKMLHNWAGHSKGVSVIRLAPDYGHLLLSGSHDNTVKIWEASGKRRLIQTWNAHEKGVKDVNFSHDRLKIISCGYDKHTRVFDTESGKCLGSYSKKQTPFCSVFYPEDNNIFFVGQSDKKIIQWDMRTGKTVQEYGGHMGPVNTVTFIEENRRFVTTSDDKSIRVWEYGMGSEVKQIAEPHMHAIAHVSKSYDGNWLLCQSGDNQIIVYSIKNQFKMQSKKVFKGHNTAGYGIGVTMSPDGKWVASGTSDGSLVFWDWKSTHIFKKLPAHSQVSVGCVWHPIEPSKVYSCSWDGTIKLWD